MKRLWVVPAIVTLSLVLSFGAMLITFNNSVDVDKAIQAERRASVIIQCEDINARHDSALLKAEELLRRSGEVVEALINEIIPKRNCEDLADRLVKRDVP